MSPTEQAKQHQWPSHSRGQVQWLVAPAVPRLPVQAVPASRDNQVRAPWSASDMRCLRRRQRFARLSEQPNMRQRIPEGEGACALPSAFLPMMIACG